MKSSTKHCSLDPAPTWLIKRAASVLAPVFAPICNASLESGFLPVTEKQALVTACLRTPSLNPDDLNSFRPIYIMNRSIFGIYYFQWPWSTHNPGFTWHRSSRGKFAIAELLAKLTYNKNSQFVLNKNICSRWAYRPSGQQKFITDK